MTSRLSSLNIPVLQITGLDLEMTLKSNFNTEELSKTALILTKGLILHIFTICRTYETSFFENYINKHNAELQRADPGTKVEG